jgi:hypothetical protein
VKFLFAMAKMLIILVCARVKEFVRLQTLVFVMTVQRVVSVKHGIVLV